MKRSDLKMRTRRELYEIAKAYGLEGRSRMSKEELIESLVRAGTRKVEPQPKPAKRRMAKRRHRRRRGVERHADQPRMETPSSRPVERPAAVPPQPYVDRGPELPAAYGEDKLQVMVRDPNWIYVYWDLSGGARERIEREAGGGSWVLRVYDLSRDSHEDVPVLIEGGNWYLPVASDTQYRIEIGVLDRHGKFHAAASSRRVRTPRMGISEIADEEWMILEEEFLRLLDMSGPMARHLSGSRMLSEVVRGRHRLAGGLSSAGVSSIGASRRK